MDLKYFVHEMNEILFMTVKSENCFKKRKRKEGNVQVEILKQTFAFAMFYLN